MGLTAICLFWTGKVGFTALRLGFNHAWERDNKVGNGISLLEWSPTSSIIRYNCLKSFNHPIFLIKIIKFCNSRPKKNI